MYKIIILIVLSVLGLGLWVALVRAGEVTISNSPMNIMFIVTLALLAIAVLGTIFFGLVNVVSSPAALKKTLFGLGGLAVVAVVSYAFASGTDVDINEMAKKGVETSQGTVKTIGTFFNIFSILTVVAIVAIIFPGIKNLFSK